MRTMPQQPTRYLNDYATCETCGELVSWSYIISERPWEGSRPSVQVRGCGGPRCSMLSLSVRCTWSGQEISFESMWNRRLGLVEYLKSSMRVISSFLKMS